MEKGNSACQGTFAVWSGRNYEKQKSLSDYFQRSFQNVIINFRCFELRFCSSVTFCLKSPKNHHVRRGSRINTDRFPIREPKVKASQGRGRGRILTSSILLGWSLANQRTISKVNFHVLCWICREQHFNLEVFSDQTQPTFKNISDRFP